MLTRAGTTPRKLTLAVILLAPLAALFATIGPIPQDPAYHALADSRAFLNVPNFANVATNAGFLVIGMLGLHLVIANRVRGASRSWALFFFGLLLVAFGSACYHLAPSDATLVWDRLPMTIAFMALFSALVAEHVAPAAEGTVLPIAVAIGILSIASWHYSGDLRLYAWVQFGPLPAIAYILVAYPARFPHRSYLVAGLAFYAVSKVFEFADIAIFSASAGTISGHSLKHLIAALAPLCVYLMLRSRIAP